MFGGLMWLEQPDGQAKCCTSAQDQRDAYVAGLAVHMPPRAPEEQGASARYDAQARKDQRQRDLFTELELELELDFRLEGTPT